MPPGTVREIGAVNGITIYASQEEYATVVHNQTQEPCKASGSGGQITVQCDSTGAGQLVVKENMWTGWYAWMDGTQVPLNWHKLAGGQCSRRKTHFYVPLLALGCTSRSGIICIRDRRLCLALAQAN